MRFLPIRARSQAARTRSVPLRLEGLEIRLTPSASTGAWVHPNLVTISFMPDGTLLGYNGLGQAVTSTLQSDFSALGSASTWQTPILKAAQIWAQQTNVNFAVVSDNGAAAGSGSYEQGDPGFGDIRIGGYKMGSGSSYELADAYLPPQLNNYSIAGDITFNTSQPYNIGSTYDVYSVAAHEFGHALGLLHSNDITAIMNPVYSGTMTGLSNDDVTTIRSVYSGGSARAQDAFDAAAANGSFTTATAITIDPTAKTAQVSGDITTTTDNDYYTFTAPTGSAATATISVQSAGLSQLAPKVYVYNAAHTQLVFASGLGHYGTTLTVTANITAGSTYFVKVIGADTTAFATGAYALTINTGTGSSPTVTLPNTQTANGTPLQSSGGQVQVPDADVANGFDRFFAHGEPAETSGDFDQAALALGLAQLDGVHGHALFVTPNMAPADFAFQTAGRSAFESLRLSEVSRAFVTRPVPFSGTETADRVFEDGDEMTLSSWFGDNDQ